MAYRVEVTEIAAVEIDNGYLWLKERSPAAAERWYHGLMASLETLREHPQRLPGYSTKMPRERRSGS